MCEVVNIFPYGIKRGKELSNSKNQVYILSCGQKLEKKGDSRRLGMNDYGGVFEILDGKLQRFEPEVIKIAKLSEKIEKD